MSPGLEFWTLACLMTAGALGLVLPSIWRGPGARAGQPQDTGGNLALLRAQMVATTRDEIASRIDAQTADRLRIEISRRILEEESTRAPRWDSGPARGWARVLAIALPVFALALYAALGEPRALTQAPRAAATSQPSMTQVEAMVSQMTQALEARALRGEAGPEDGPAWAMAARTLASMQRFKEADQAFARALALRPDDANLLADRADILSLLQGQDPVGEPMRLIERALRIDPHQPKALALAGSVAFKRGDMAAAIAHWQRALANLPPESEFARGLAQSLQEARQTQAMQRVRGDLAPAPTSTSPRIAAAPSARSAATASAPSVRGRVGLSPALRAKLRPDDTVFIVARAAQGPRMPLAILRLRASDLPAVFTLDDSSAMSPQMRLSAYSDVVISARVSRSGEALPQAGDLVGEPVQARVGASGVELRIDRVQP